MTVGLILLLVVSVLIFLGLAHRVLDRMRLNDRQALVAVLSILIGGFIDIPVFRGLWTVSVNLGGSVIPVIIAIYVLSRADTQTEARRGVLSAVATGAALLAISKIFTFEEGRTIIDPIYVFGLVAGVIAYLLGRSRRAAFAGAVLGVVFLDIAHLVEVIIRRLPSTVNIGGAGAFDAVIIAGLIAVGFAEIFGETMERLQTLPDEPEE
ncbi:MAG: DUF1614 domain-containing protein [Bacillota bacterium]|nr:DUF1614 domain-containing protein [Bacillota bacterium]MDI9415322.1 DUF1614 domain-containing protein [Bacillota bacterium]NLD12845.1 DUF1614 domain-containing protein [Bacillota bacterium]HOB88059.1 DUF1614 domain-containing protein [Bacillota bacterium]HOJ57069.1 DUF1614 domain-containing protein [Bacillota bacterium]